MALVNEEREAMSHGTDAEMEMSLTPFTTWHVEIDDVRNPDAELSQVTEIQMKLYGFEMERLIQKQLLESYSAK